MSGDGLAGYACGLGSGAYLRRGGWSERKRWWGLRKRYGLTGEHVSVDAGDANGFRGLVGGYHVAVNLSTLTPTLVNCINNFVNASKSYRAASLRVATWYNLLDTLSSSTTPKGARLTRRKIKTRQVAAAWRWWCWRCWCRAGDATLYHADFISKAIRPFGVTGYWFCT